MAERDVATYYLGVRTTPETAEQLKALRRQMQAVQQFGKVSMGEALSFAVGSASAALAEQGRRRDGPS